MSLGPMANLRSMGSHLQKNLKGLSTSRLTSRLQPSRRATAATGHARSTSSSNLRGRPSASSKFSAENADGERDERKRVTSPRFRIPNLPTVGKRDTAGQGDLAAKRLLSTGNTKRNIASSLLSLQCFLNLFVITKPNFLPAIIIPVFRRQSGNSTS
jgi:hypothetical protein